MPGWNGPLSAFVLLSVALKSTAVLCAASLIVLLLRRQSAAMRHLVWTAAFFIIGALPFFSIALPTLKIPVSSRLLPSEIAFQVTSNTPPNASASQSQLPAHSAQGATPYGQRVPDWRVALFFLWGLGAFVSLGHMLAALAVMRRIRRNARPVTFQNVSSLAGCLDIKRPVEFFETQRGNMPMNFGLFHQAIFLPSDVLEESEERSRLVILHELAHVRRHDAVIHILVRTVLSIYWWHPLAWFAWHEFLNERERAADDLVLNTGARPSEYANHLLEIATSMQSLPALASAAIAMARRSQLEGRLISILESGRNRGGIRPMAVLWCTMLAILIAAPLAALQSQDRAPSSPPADPVAEIQLATEQRNPEVLDEAAKAAEALRNYDLAQKLLQSSLTLRGQFSGQQSPSYGIGLLHLADFARERGKFNEAQPLYTKAIPLLGKSPEAAAALLHIGTMTLINKNTREAIDDFTRAQSLNSADSGNADMWMAIAQEQEGFTAQADSAYQTALRKSDPNSALAATIMELYAQFLNRQGRTSEAKPLLEQSEAIRKALGAQNETSKASKIGGDVTTPVLLSKVEPEYSQDARAAKYQGTVLMYVEIGPDGLAHNVRVTRGLGLGLNEKAIQAVRLWKFKPSTKDGQPVTVQANIEVNFRLL